MFEEEKSWNWNQGECEESTQTATFTVVGEVVTEERESESNNTNDNTESMSTDGAETPMSQALTQRLNSDDYDDSTEPRKFRRLDDIYNEI